MPAEAPLPLKLPHPPFVIRDFQLTDTAVGASGSPCGRGQIPLINFTAPW